jgi:hypothetical protein
MLWQIMWGIMLVPPIVTLVLFLLLYQPSFTRVPDWVSKQKKCDSLGCDRPATRAYGPISSGQMDASERITFSTDTRFYCDKHGRLRQCLGLATTALYLDLVPVECPVWHRGTDPLPTSGLVDASIQKGPQRLAG